MQSDNQREIRLILEMAPSFQGGHSHIGAAVADLLGIPFPLRMVDLKKAALERGYEPTSLWPWLAKQESAS